jgi:hypothetical protein
MTRLPRSERDDRLVVARARDRNALGPVGSHAVRVTLDLAESGVVGRKRPRARLDRRSKRTRSPAPRSMRGSDDAAIEFHGLLGLAGPPEGPRPPLSACEAVLQPCRGRLAPHPWSAFEP